MAGVEIGSKSEAASVDLVLKFVGEKEGGCLKDSPGGPVLRIHLAMQGTRVRSLVRELRSHMLQSI